MEETAIRQALGLDEQGDILASVNALKAAAKDIATGEKGAENRLTRELADAQRAHLSEVSELTQRVLKLEDENRQTKAAAIVDAAIAEGRILPKDRERSIKLALNDLDDFKEFAKTLRVDLNERGRQMDAAMAALEPTEGELASARQAGVTREQLIAQKARDAGVSIPS